MQNFYTFKKITDGIGVSVNLIGYMEMYHVSVNLSLPY